MSTEEAKQLIQELEKLRRQTRRFRLLTIIAMFAIVIAGVSAIIESVYSLTLAGPRQEEFVRNLSAGLKDNLLPTVEKIAGRSVEALKPAVEKELREMNGRAPEVADVALRELDEMGGELTVKAGKILDQTVTGTLQQRQGKLRQMYPDVYDRQIDVLLNNLALEVQDQFAQSGENIFNPHLNSIQSILTNLDKIQKTEPVDASQHVDSWQVAYMFMDVFVHEFKGLGPPEPADVKAAVAEKKVVQPRKTKEKKK
jgi:predicted PurR-regulated permease PerM